MTSYLHTEAHRSSAPALTLIRTEERTGVPVAALAVARTGRRTRLGLANTETDSSLRPALHQALLHSVSSLVLYGRLLALIDVQSISTSAKHGDLDAFRAYQELLAGSEGRCPSPSLSLKTRAVLLGILQEVLQDEEQAFLHALVCWLGEQLDGWLEAALRDPDLAGSMRSLAPQHRMVQEWRRRALDSRQPNTAGGVVASVGQKRSHP